MRISGVLTFLLMVSGATAAAAADQPKATCVIAFSGTSSLHGFEGSIPPITTRLQPSTASPGKWDADLSVPVASMTTSNESRDAKMREMFDAEHSPDIRVALREFDPQDVKRKAEIAGTLTIAGKSREFVASLNNWRENDSDVSFDLTATVSLERFGLSAPTVLGLIRVADEVEVTAHVAVEDAAILREPSAAANSPQDAPKEAS
ncbi:MAG TPA: YceI family protein [Candidatus Limnocylindrales bacterium]|nr:YceI family protein [Candidatus Limnocylindrales bacterium]